MKSDSSFDDLELLEQMLADEGVERAAHQVIPRLGADARIPASFQQERLWLVDQLEPGSAAMNMSAALALDGVLHIEALSKALGHIVRRHAVLRTTFANQGEPLLQVVAPAGLFFLPEEDVADEPTLRRRIEEETQRTFDLRRGPLFRATLLRCAKERNVLVVVLHHAIADGWSIGVFTRELGELYTAEVAGRPAALPELAISYGDYAAWQRTRLDGERVRAGLEWWKGELRDLPVIELPTDFRRPTRPGAIEGGRQALNFSPALSRALRRIAEGEGATLAMATLASWQALLSRYTGQTEVAVGIPTANRGHEDLDGLIGFFVNMLVIRTDTGGRPGLRTLIRRVRDRVLAAHEWQEIPFQQIVDDLKPERLANRHPLFQVALAFQNLPGGALVLPSLKVSRIDEDQTARFDLEVFLGEQDGGLAGTIAYDRRLFRPATIARLARHWEVLLTAAVAAPDAPLALLPLLDVEESADLRREHEAAAVSWPAGTVVDLWRAQVAATPHAAAVIDGATTWSFAELAARSAAIATELGRRKFGPEEVVGIWFDRSPEMVAAILGVLEAGGAYLPLDPANPVDRLHFMLEDSQARWVVGRACPADELASRWINLDLLHPTPDAPVRPPVAAEHLAYVIYTSGSTGKPKGSEITHAGLVNYLRWAAEAYEVAAGSGAPLHSSIAFDLTVTSLFPPLLAGRPVQIVRAATGPGGLAAALRQGANASPLKLTPAHLHVLNGLVPAMEAAGRARVFVIGGEQLLPAHVAFWRQHAPSTRLINEYGPTETGVGCCVHEVTDADLTGDAIPIGRPIANTQLHVLDAALEPVPAGVTGELWIGGAGVARGYRFRADLTADRFRPDPFAVAPGARLYRTGDRVRRRADGVFEFLGRYDDQLKLRGHRIEPGEIEAALAQHPAVREAVVMLREDRPGDSRLVAYVAPEASETGRKWDEWQEEHVGQWRLMFEENYRQPVPTDDPTFNIVGWNSSYDGRPMPATEIREWLDVTVAQLRAEAPRRVLEIGCGSGMILFALAPDCEDYLGIDLSQAAVDNVARLAAERGWRAVRVRQGEAGDFTGVPPGSFDLTVINSVVQYFSGAAHLEAVLRGAVAATAPGGAVFVGDVRSLALLPAYHASVQFHRAGEDVTREELADRVRRQIAREEELVIDPAFFETFQRSEPAITAVEFRPRIGLACNELTKFRYDVLLRVGPSRTPVTEPRRLAPAVAAELARDVAVLDWIAGSGNEDTVGALRRRLAEAPAAEPRLTPIDRVAEESGVNLVAETNHPLQAKAARALVPALQTHLRSRVPEYMVPTAFVLLDRLPLTVNGKVDRRALPVPALEPERTVADYAAPRGPEEEMLAGIWSDVLGLTRVGVEDNFFALGGHSLLAAQVVARVRVMTGRELPLTLIFEQPTVAALARTLAAKLVPEDVEPALVAETTEGPLALSFPQERLWFLEQLVPEQRTYHVSVLLRLSGRVDAVALAQALGELTRRHAVLRTVFATEDGRGQQRVLPSGPFALPCEDLTIWPVAERRDRALAGAQAEASRLFDFGRGPLLRARLFRLEPQEHLLLAATHHIVSDGWSISVIVRELAELYAAARRGTPAALAEPSLQYGDYARWQRGWLRGEVLARKLAYWRERLTDAPTLELPGDFPRPAVLSGRGQRVPFAVSQEVTVALQSIAREHGATLFMTLLAAFAAWLRRESGQDDLVVGTSVANRQRRELEPLVGFFVNTLALRVETADEQTFTELVAQTRTRCLEAYAHQDVPFEAVVEAVVPRRDLSRTPLFQVMLVLLNLPPAELRLEELVIVEEPLSTETAKFELMLLVQETPDGLAGAWEFSTDLFTAETVARFGRHLTTLITAAVERPALVLGELPLQPRADVWRRLEESNEAARQAVPSITLAMAFEAVVAAQPERIALSSGSEGWTYAELNLRANRLAWHLRGLGVGPEVPVALLMERSSEAIVAMLAVLKAGGFFVPLNPDEPLERLSQLFETVQPVAVLLQERLAERLPSFFVYTLAVDTAEDAFAGERTDNPPSVNGPDDLAYVMHTSGSTGLPKGVAVPHRAVVRLVARPNFMSVVPDDVVLQLAPLSFDASVLEIWLPLCHGARLEVMPPGAASLAEIGAGLKTAKITTAWFTAGLFHQMIDHQIESFGGLHQVLAGGDALSVAHVQRLLGRWPALRVINGYGPTENTVFTCCHTVTAADRLTTSVPIGRPVTGTSIVIVDRRGEPVPMGVPGELMTGGAGLARGYFGQPMETAARFRPDPWSGGMGSRWYRTGDRARWLPDGSVEFLGRSDQQIKLRGFRIELGEIEAALRLHPAVSDVVVAAPGTGAERQLAAYFTGGADPVELRTFLAERLPDYMVPAFYVPLAELPLGRNGKVNRQALPAVEATTGARRTGLGARTPLEARLTAIWEHVLDASPIGVRDEFFELGGHSLLATRLLAEVEKRLGARLSLNTLFQGGTIEAMAVAIEAGPDTGSFSPLVALKPEGVLPPIFCVHPGGGSVLSFFPLAAAIPPERPFYGLQAPGLDGREPPLRSVEALAAAHVRAIRAAFPVGPYHLAGHSFGGSVAYEMARQLEASAPGERGVLFVLDHLAPDRARAGIDHEPTDIEALEFMAHQIGAHFGVEFTLPAAELEVRDPAARLDYFLTRAMEVGIAPPGANTAMIAGLVAVYQANLHALLRYQPGPLAGGLVLVRTADLAAATADDPTAGWATLVKGSIEVVETGGDHNTMLRTPHVTALAALLAAHVSHA